MSRIKNKSGDLKSEGGKDYYLHHGGRWIEIPRMTKEEMGQPISLYQITYHPMITWKPDGIARLYSLVRFNERGAIGQLQGVELSMWFLRELFGNAEGLIHLFCLPSKAQCFERDTAQIKNFITDHMGENIYFGACTKLSNNGTAENACQAPALWADVDFKKFSGDIATQQKAAEQSIEALGLEPTFINHTGHGYQCWWKLVKPVPATATVSKIVQHIAQNLNGDNVSDLARRMRLPGTINYKEPHDLKTATIAIHNPHLLYTLDAFKGILRIKGAVATKEPVNHTKILKEGLKEGHRDNELLRTARSSLRNGVSPEDTLAYIEKLASYNCEQGGDFDPKETARRVTAQAVSYHNREIGPAVDISLVEPISEVLPFPESAWTGLFKQWRDLVEPHMDMPYENIWAAFLSAVGLMFGRTLATPSALPLYPNFYILLLGRTTYTRKTTTIELSKALTNRIDPRIRVVEGMLSSEAIARILGEKADQVVLIIFDEFRTLLSRAQRKGTQDILSALNSFWNCSEHASLDSASKTTEILRAFTSIMSGTPSEYVERMLGRAEIDGGFLNRFMMVKATERETKENPTHLSIEEWNSIVRPLKDIRDHYRVAGEYGHYMLRRGEEAQALYSQYEQKKKETQKGQSEDAILLTARTGVNIFKLAMIYAALNKEKEIGGQSMDTAIQIAQWLASNAIEVFGDVSLEVFEKMGAKMDRILKRGALTRRDLSKFSNVKDPIFSKVLKSRLDMGIYRKRSGVGKAKVVELIEYVPEDDDNPIIQ